MLIGLNGNSELSKPEFLGFKWKNSKKCVENSKKRIRKIFQFSKQKTVAKLLLKIFTG